MQKTVCKQVGLILILGLFSCKTKSKDSASSTVTPSSSSAVDSSVPSCPTNLALAEIGEALQVDSTKLTTQNLSVTSIPIGSGSSNQVLKIELTGHPDADFVFYEICKSGTSNCKRGILAHNADGSGSSDVTYDGRLDAGDYTVTVSSAIWNDREKNGSAKDRNYSGRPGRIFHSGPAISSSIKGFVGTPQGLRDLFIQNDELEDKTGAILQKFQKDLMAFKGNKKVNPQLLKSINNVRNMREKLKEMVESPLFAETKNAASAAQDVNAMKSGLNLADAATSCPEVAAIAAQTSPTVQQDAASQANAAAAAQAAQAAALAAANTPTPTTTPTPATSATTTATETTQGFSDFDIARMNCDSRKNEGYSWIQADATSTSTTTYPDKDGMYYGCFAAPSSTISNTLVTADPTKPMAGDDSKDLGLWAGGLALVSLGGIVGITGGIKVYEYYISKTYKAKKIDTVLNTIKKIVPDKISTRIGKNPKAYSIVGLVSGALMAAAGGVMINFSGYGLADADVNTQIMNLANSTAAQVEKNIQAMTVIQNKIQAQL